MIQKLIKTLYFVTKTLKKLYLELYKCEFDSTDANVQDVFFNIYYEVIILKSLLKNKVVRRISLVSMLLVLFTGTVVAEYGPQHYDLVVGKFNGSACTSKLTVMENRTILGWKLILLVADIL